MKRTLITIAALAVLTPAAHAATTISPARVAARLTAHFNATKFHDSPAMAVDAACQVTAFPHVTGLAYLCSVATAFKSSPSLGRGSGAPRSNWMVQVGHNGNLVYTGPIMAGCLPPVYCDPANMNVGGGLTQQGA